MKTLSLNFFDVYPGRNNRTRTLAVYNEGDTPMTLTYRNVPNHIHIDCDPEVIEPKQQGRVLVTFETEKVKDWGTRTDVIDIYVRGGLVCYGFSNFISHSAAASLLTPVLGVVAGAMVAGGTLTQGGLSQMLIGVAIAASVSMILPISTPPNAIAHSTGFIQQKDMIKVGLIIGLLGLVIGYCWMFLVF